jgi:septal ring factor EnvC (AmiA/AmiB activator)
LIDPAKEHTISEAIAANIREVLTELANMPKKVTNPQSWLAELEREELGTAAERQPTPGQAMAQQAKAERLRARKTETMRRLRAEGRA